MTKETVKKAAPKKKASAKKAAVSKEQLLVKVSEESLKKLESLGINEALQADIRWCIGSYNYDKNPVGLYEMAAKALKVFEEAKKKNAKAVPTKLMTDLKKVIAA